MRTHIKIVGIIHIALNFMGVVTALFAMLVYFVGATALGLVTGSEDAGFGAMVFGAMSSFGLFIGCGALLPSLPGFLAGIGALRLRNWSRWVLIVISVIYVLSPLWFISLYCLWVLLDDRAAFLFKGGVGPEPSN
jgi:hypothetical protein